jgi:hypothetical protein
LFAGHRVVDAQVHAWDASPQNQAGPAGERFAAGLLARHRELDGAAGTLADVERVTAEGLERDVFTAGHVDRAVLQPVLLGDLFVLGFSPTAWHAELAAPAPERFVLSGELDPDAGQAGARGIAARVRRHDLRGLTFGESRRPGGRTPLGEPWLRRVLARCAASGAGVVHLGTTPAVRPAPWERWRPAPGRGPRLPSWAEPVRSGSALPVRTRPVRRVPSAAFDVARFRELATALPRTSFVLSAGCLPPAPLHGLARLPNVHVVLTEILPWIGTPEFGRAFGDLLRAFGPERLLFGSGYPLVRPGRLVERLAAYRFPPELRGRHPDPDADVLRAVLGGNAERLYGLVDDAPAVARSSARS